MLYTPLRGLQKIAEILRILQKNPKNIAIYTQKNVKNCENFNKKGGGMGKKNLVLVLQSFLAQYLQPKIPTYLILHKKCNISL